MQTDQTSILGPRGFRFGGCCRMGLIDALMVAVSVPLLLGVRPL